MDPARRGALVQVKLNALARDELGVDVDVATAVPFPGGAALVVADGLADGLAGQRGIVYVADDATLPLGAAVVWAAGQSPAPSDGRSADDRSADDRSADDRSGAGLGAGLGRLDVILDNAEAAAIAARQAPGLAVPVTIWHATGPTLNRPPSVLGSGLKPPEVDLAPLLAAISGAGATVSVEQGVVVGEVDGLEVARVVANEDGTQVLRVGVGVYDQEAYAVMHPGDVAGAGLAEVVARVREHRRPGAPGHMINRLARERWLRAQLVARPDLVGAVSLEPTSGLVPRLGLHQAMPATAHGLSEDGRVLLVVCSTGVDPQVIAVAADGLAADGSIERVVVAVPPRDVHPALVRAATWLRVPGELIGVPAPWDATADR